MERFARYFTKYSTELVTGGGAEALGMLALVGALAAGYAIYDPAVDKDAESVFKRADEAMYEQKKQMKAVRHS